MNITIINPESRNLIITTSKYEIKINMTSDNSKKYLTTNELYEIYQKEFSKGINTIDEYYESDFYKKYMKH